MLATKGTLSIHFAFLLTVACSSPTATESAVGVEVRIAASSAARDASGTATLAFTVVNGGTQTVLLDDICGARLLPAIERRTGGAWASYATGACQTIHDMSPKPLALGATRADAVAVSEPGTYRLVISTDRGQISSAAFSVE